jgi:hypothetical protein
MVPAELRTLVTSVTLEATAVPLFVKSTVTFVGLPVAEGSGETACNEMLGDANGLEDGDGLAGANGLCDDGEVVDDGLDDGVADAIGLEDDDGVADADGVADDDGLADAGDDGAALADGLEVCTGCPVTCTENDLVARPWPPCHTSKPASTSIRYHDGLIQPRLTASSMSGRRSKLLIEVVPGVIW